MKERKIRTSDDIAKEDQRKKKRASFLWRTILATKIAGGLYAGTTVIENATGRFPSASISFSSDLLSSDTQQQTSKPSNAVRFIYPEDSRQLPVDAKYRPIVTPHGFPSENLTLPKSNNRNMSVLHRNHVDINNNQCWATPSSDAGRQAVSANYPNGQLLHAPSVSVDYVKVIFDGYNSPFAKMKPIVDVCGKKTPEQWFMDYFKARGIDPAYVLAELREESDVGTRGEALLTHNPLNIRPSYNWQPSLDNFRYYKDWREGFLKGLNEYANLLINLYVKQWGLTTVDTIIPVYAPSEDNNVPSAYINAMDNFMKDEYLGSLRLAEQKHLLASVLRKQTKRHMRYLKPPKGRDTR